MPAFPHVAKFRSDGFPPCAQLVERLQVLCALVFHRMKAVGMRIHLFALRADVHIDRGKLLLHPGELCKRLFHRALVRLHGSG